MTAAGEGLPPRVRRRLERALGELRWRRYRDDRLAFYADCVQVKAGKVLGGGKRRLPFELFDYQVEAEQVLDVERYVAILKARQLGLTTLVMARALHRLLFEPGVNILLVSKDQDTADSALEMLDFMWRFLPGWMRDRAPTLENDSVREHVWRHADGMTSRIVSKPATKTVGAGETFDWVIWDEAALAKHQEDTEKTLSPTTDAGGDMTVFSTARGAHNKFAQMFRDAERGESEYATIFFPWYVSRLMNPLADRVANCPHGPCDRCIDYSRYEAKRRTKRDALWEFYSEYPATPDEAFRQSGRTRFEGMPPTEEFDEFPRRGRLAESGGGEVVFIDDEDGPLRVDDVAFGGAASPAVVSVDPASGDGGDYTAITAGWLDQDGVPVRVAFWHDNDHEQSEAAQQAALLGRWLRFGGRDAKLVVERQGGYGETIVHELRHNLKYRNLYLHRYTGHRKRKREMTYGFPMNRHRRPLVINALAQWLRFDDDMPTMVGIDRMFRRELGSFVVKEGGRVEADVGCHDDLVMSAAIWCYVLTEDAGEAATSGRKGEQPDPVRHSVVASIWDEADRVRRGQARANRQFAREITRRAR